jgi:hypothetical protein
MTTGCGGASPRQKARDRIARSPCLQECLYFRQCEFLRPVVVSFDVSADGSRFVIPSMTPGESSALVVMQD